MSRLHSIYTAITIVICGAAVAATIAFLHYAFSVPASVLLHDLNAINASPPYYGLLSNLGIIIWTATATITLWTYASVRSYLRRRQLQIEVLLFGGIFTAIIMIDDLFMLHEQLPKLGLPGALYPALYGGLQGAFLVVFIHPILKSEWLLLLGALGFFGISITLDVAADAFSISFIGRGYIEDIAKFVGILFWFTYFASLSWTALQECLRST